MAEVPAANPSIPSVKFAPLEIAVMIKITTGMKINQERCSTPGNPIDQFGIIKFVVFKHRDGGDGRFFFGINAEVFCFNSSI